MSLWTNGNGFLSFGEVPEDFVYLHEECSQQIMHCHIKLSQNITMEPKIADFGLGKLLMSNETLTLNRHQRDYGGIFRQIRQPISLTITHHEASAQHQGSINLPSKGFINASFKINYRNRNG